MNDPTYVEAARALAGRAMAETADPAGRIEAMCTAVLARRPTDAELGLMLDALRSGEARSEEDREPASGFVSAEAPAVAGEEPSDLAAYAAVGSLILNLDEALTKE